jgi:hypothetical protein
MSEFKNHVCWTSAMVNEVFVTDVGSLEPEEFLATHHPLKVKQIPVGGIGSEWVTEDAVIDYFKEDVSGDQYKLVPVVGDTGSGKTHLVRRVYEGTKDVTNWHVVYLEKGNTKLSAVIKSLLEGLEPGDFVDSVREKLEGSSDVERSDAWYRTELIHRIASMVELGGKKSDSQQEKLARRRVPDVLRDPATRGQMMASGGIIDRLVKQALGEMDGNEKNFADEPEVVFTDLPNDARGAGKSAVDALSSWAGTNASRVAALEVINQARAGAIRGLFVGDVPLDDLMEKLRKELKDKNKELVIFVEEMAVLHGVELHFLEAIIKAGNKELCNLRVMLACTEDKFAGMDTLKDRFADSFCLDRSHVDEVFTEEEAFNFISRYLNAARNKEVKNYINNCGDCAFKTACHKSFGSACPDSTSGEEYGLYPFTEGAIERFVQKSTSVREGQGGKLVTPRDLIKDLKSFLFKAERYLQEGTFISAENAAVFFEDHRDHGWGADLRDAVAREYPGDGETLVRYWTPIGYPAKLQGEELIVSLEGGAGLFDAFGISPGQVVQPPVGIKCACQCGCSGGRACNCSERGCQNAGATPGCACSTSSKVTSVATTWEGTLSSSTYKNLVKALDEWSGEKELSVRESGEVRGLIRDVVLKNLDACRAPLQQSAIKKLLSVGAQLKKVIDVENSGGVKDGDALLSISAQDSAHALRGIIRISELSEEDDEFPGRDEHRRSSALAINEWSDAFSKHFDNEGYGDIEKEMDALLIRALTGIGEKIANGPRSVQQNLFTLATSSETDLRTAKWKKLVEKLSEDSGKYAKYEEAVVDAVGETRGPSASVAVIHGHRLIQEITNRIDIQNGCLTELFSEKRDSRKFVEAVDKEWDLLLGSIECSEDIDFGIGWDTQVKGVLETFHVAKIQGVLPAMHMDVKNEIDLLSDQTKNDSHQSVKTLKSFVAANEKVTLFDKIGFVTSGESLSIIKVGRLIKLMKSVLGELERGLKEVPTNGPTEERMPGDAFLEKLEKFKQAVQEESK